MGRGLILPRTYNARKRGVAGLDPYFDDVKLVANFENYDDFGGFSRGSGTNVETDFVRFGVGSTLPRNGALYRQIVSNDVTLTDEFCIEAWFYFGGLEANSRGFFNCGSIHSVHAINVGFVRGSNQFFISIHSSNGASGSSYSQSYVFGSTIFIAQWYHIALSSDGTNYRLFVDGKKVAETSSAIQWQPRAGEEYVRVGRARAGGILSTSNGNVDSLRYTRIDRYISDFKPPTRPFVGP